MSDSLLGLAAVTPNDLKPPRICIVGKLYASLDPDRSAALRHLVEESGHSAVRISKACQDAGVALSHNMVSTHRRRDCQCPT